MAPSTEYEVALAALRPPPLDAHLVALTERYATKHEFGVGELLSIPTADDGETRVYYLLDGFVWTIMHDEDGRDHIVEMLGPGSLMGDVWPAKGLLPIVVSYQFVSPTTAISWASATIRDLACNEPEIGMAFLRSLSGKVQLLMRHIQMLSFCSAEQRVLQAVAQLAAWYGQPEPEGIRLRIRLTQTDVGAMINVSRVTVSKVFKRLSSSGLIKKQDGFFLVHDPERLFRLAAGAEV